MFLCLLCALPQILFDIQKKLFALQRILIIQTAFTGDVILATAAAESLHITFPDCEIDFLVRKGNETLLSNHPFIKNILVWDKKENKISSLVKTILLLRKKKYDLLINLHRFFSSGFITCFANATEKRGFNKNPLSICFDKKFKHEIGNGKHEVERNFELITDLVGDNFKKPALYPSLVDFENTAKYKSQKFVCIAPASVWFTKQFSQRKWVELISQLPENVTIYFLGARSDFNLCEQIKVLAKNKNALNLCGKLSFLESAALMKEAVMNYVNDSAPLHIATAMHAPITAFFCSTIPAFGFGPLNKNAIVVETKEKLDCRPCGLHGYRSCPLGHFNCSEKISLNELSYNF